MSPYLIGIVVGLIIGAAAGFFCACLLACSREDNFWRNNIKKGMKGGVE